MQPPQPTQGERSTCRGGPQTSQRFVCKEDQDKQKAQLQDKQPTALLQLGDNITDQDLSDISLLTLVYLQANSPAASLLILAAAEHIREPVPATHAYCYCHRELQHNYTLVLAGT